MNKYLISILILFVVEFSFANPLPGPLPDAWDNLNGTAGEPLCFYDTYLVRQHNFRMSFLFDPISTTTYADSFGTRQETWLDYYRINMAISFEYGVSRFVEVGFRVPYVVRSSSMLFTNTHGFSDFSTRVRVKVYGDQEKPLYLAIGGGIKFPTTDEEDIYSELQLSEGSFDIFFGTYNIINFGMIKFPGSFTFSHTGRDMRGDQMGELITYRFGLISEIGDFASINLGVKGYRITQEYIQGFATGDINKTSAEAGLAIKIAKSRIILSGGLVNDLMGKRSYIATSPIFVLQINL